jgi:uncharacterized protein (TIGR02186 family)
MIASPTSRRAAWCLALLLGVPFALNARADVRPAVGQTGALSVAPDRVGIDLLFGGADLTVRAEIPAGFEAGVRLIGPRQQVQLKRKGRIWGVLWTGVEEVTLDDVPVAYMVSTSAPLSELAAADDLASRDLGYGALIRDAGGEGDVFRELIKLKQREGLYAESVGDLTVTTGGEAGRATLVASFRLPARIPPGAYAIDVFGFQGGRVHAVGSAAVQVEQVGLARAIHGLAMQHGLVYGVAAAIVAIIAGLVTGLIFGLRSAKGH